MPVEGTVNCPPPNLERAGHGSFAHSGLEHGPHGGDVVLIHHGRPPADLSASSRSSQAGERAVSNEVSLELAERAGDVEDESAGRGVGVDGLREAPEVLALLPQRRDYVQQIPHGTPQAVQAPHNKGVTRVEVIQGGRELRAPAAGAGGVLGEDPHATGNLQRIDLRLGRLLERGDAGVADQVAGATA